MRIGSRAWIGRGSLRTSVGPIVVAARRPTAVAQHLGHEVDRFVEPADALARPRAELDAERRVLLVEPGGPDAEHRAPVAQVVEGRDLLHDEGRVAERVGAHHQAEGRSLGGDRPTRRGRCSPRGSARSTSPGWGRGGPTSRASRSRAASARAALARIDGQSVYWFQRSAPSLMGFGSVTRSMVRR